jgi:hypothetical protein
MHIREGWDGVHSLTNEARGEGRPEDAEVFGMEQRDSVITSMPRWSMVNESERVERLDSVLARINSTPEDVKFR